MEVSLQEELKLLLFGLIRKARRILQNGWDIYIIHYGGRKLQYGE
jgi:hypothetical protein